MFEISFNSINKKTLLIRLSKNRSQLGEISLEISEDPIKIWIKIYNDEISIGLNNFVENYNALLYKDNGNDVKDVVYVGFGNWKEDMVVKSIHIGRPLSHNFTRDHLLEIISLDGNNLFY